MMNQYKPLIITMIISLLCACEEVVEPSLISAEPIVVVEGQISNQIGGTSVYVSMTAPFNESGANPPVSSARVQLRDKKGQLIAFFEQTPGLYVPSDLNFIGIPDNQYSISVRIGEFIYQASTSMPRPPQIDSLSFSFEPKILDQNAGYYVSYHYQDPIAKNYHLLNFWQNGKIVIGNKFEIRNDENVNGKYLKFVVPQPFNAFDTVSIQLFSIPEHAYKYFEGLNLLVESGSPSQAVPENPKGNITSDDAPVLGIFYATATTKDSIVIRP